MIAALIFSLYAWIIFASYLLWSPWPIVCALVASMLIFIGSFFTDDDDDY